MWTTVLLLVISNLFMTVAWYGHLRHRQAAIAVVVVVSWLIAFFEYCFQVPANRIGYNAGLTGAQLKTIQEVVTLTIFVVFAATYLREPIRWNVVVGFVLIVAGAAFVFQPWKSEAANAGPQRAEAVGEAPAAPPSSAEASDLVRP
jgi:uncharacterized protein